MKSKVLINSFVKEHEDNVMACSRDMERFFDWSSIKKFGVVNHVI